MIYVCATMWHETTSEMVQLLKSIFRYMKDSSVMQILSFLILLYRLDSDQHARRTVQKNLTYT